MARNRANANPDPDPNLKTKREELRARIVEAAQKMLQKGLVVGSLGNVSARDPQDMNVMHITPTGLPYERMVPSDVATMTVEGEVLSGKPSSEWRLHAAIYRAFPEARAAVHAHGIYAQAWSFLSEPLPAHTEELAIFAGGDVRVARYAPSGTQELARNAVQALEGRRAALLARHGIVALGASLEEALTVCEIVERQAHVALLLRMLRVP